MGNCGSEVRCGKCDGAHLSDDCPVYSKPREDHPDAQAGHSPTKSEMADCTVTKCRVVRQPADNHCLFHCLAYNLNKHFKTKVKARDVRAELSQWVAANPDVEVKGQSVIDLVRVEYPNEELSATSYAQRIASTQRWGGLPELLAASQLYNMEVRVWVQTSKWTKRYTLISKFEAEGTATEPLPLDILFDRSQLHYDCLILPPYHPLLRPKKRRPPPVVDPAASGSSDGSRSS
eukprot:TRINITY_DN11535_c0_g1_i3.p1 TRINITY_DN11535_c0_g1~~TRINITY_DN11535_c0_g1_i3.p1  ORF type:complete len:233 (+),score=42.64 TRINITY_DN11535_c0_g1_i3:69-767(+)